MVISIIDAKFDARNKYRICRLVQSSSNRAIIAWVVAKTLVVGQIALVMSVVIALVLYPPISRHFGNAVMRSIGMCPLVVMRSTPELILGFVFLLLWGPSLLPAITALAIHNGAIVAHLTGRNSDNI